MSWDRPPVPLGSSEKVSSNVQQYSLLHRNTDEAKEQRLDNYATQTNLYYDMATDFYERGWGESFHFAPRYNDEGFVESLKRHEYYLAHRLGLQPGMKVIDVGCGVGGPLRNIARFSGASIVGLNNNQYQISRVETLNASVGLSKTCSALKADFMHIPEKDNTFDAAYQIEATCHSPKRVDVYKEIYRVMKPGTLFGGYEWVLTDKYDAKNSEHQRIRRELEIGTGIPELIPMKNIKPALIEAGFEVIEIVDLALQPGIPWWDPLAPKWSRSNWQMTNTGHFVISSTIRLLEYVRLLPSGTSNIQTFLFKGGHALYESGKLEIFTPMCFHLARKPL